MDKSGTQVDLGKLPSYAGYQIRQAQIAVFKDISKRFAEADLTPGEFSLLTLIGGNRNIEQGTLARVYDLDKSTLSHAVGRLLSRKLIARRRAAHDGRRYQLSLTETGANMLATATQAIEDQERIMEQALGSCERDRMLSMLDKIAIALRSARA